ncbi:ATP-dependent RNA helicase DHX58-like [Amphiura filiformis]|uniref:ATP-dependent RNA helicase DHX58-like n=1 Tax=Amphiura filiformis TaxID=82378 RepID=UPI003B2103DE
MQGATSNPQITPENTPAIQITPHTSTATTSQTHLQDISAPVGSKSSTEAVRPQDLSVRPKERKFNVNATTANQQDTLTRQKPTGDSADAAYDINSGGVQNQTKHVGPSQIGADNSLPSSNTGENLNDRPFKSLTSHSEQYDQNQLQSILEKSGPDSSDLGGEILTASAASTLSAVSTASASTPSPPTAAVNSEHQSLHEESSDGSKLVKELADLSLDGPGVDDVDPTSGMASDNKDDLETDAPDESMDDKTANPNQMSTIKEGTESILPADNSDDKGGASVLSNSSMGSSISPDDSGSSSSAMSSSDSKPQHEESDEQPNTGTQVKQLRAYQTELATPPMSGSNYIICAPTGSGKTLTAAAICHHFYQQSVTNNSDFKALFIVNIRHLTKQQRYEFKERFPRDAVRTIGDTGLLKDVLFADGVSVVFVTAQIVVNALQKREIQLQDIAMMIFDECHHTTQKHPYNEIMRRYLKEKIKYEERKVGKSGNHLPHIIGLSASLGFNNVVTLCSNLDAKNVLQVSKHKKELAEYMNAPENDTILYASRRRADQRDLGHILENIMFLIEKDVWGNESKGEYGTQVYEMTMKECQNDTSDRKQYIAAMYLYEYNRALMLYEDLTAITAFKYLEAFMEKRDLEQEQIDIEDLCRRLFEEEMVEMKRICQEERKLPNPKLVELAELLKKKFESKPGSKGIILTRMRLATNSLIEFIDSAQALQGLKPRVGAVRLVGKGESSDYFMTEKDQKKSLDSFRDDDSCNLLVATDIAQEGLDMPACNFVIRYNFVSNEIGTVQSKGRARAKQSECYLIVEEDSINDRRELSNRAKVTAMEKEMDEFNLLSEAERIRQITKQQEVIYKDLKEEAGANKLQAQMSVAADMLCRECKTYITNSSFMRKNGCNYTCVDPDVEDKVIVVLKEKPDRYRDSETIGVFKCANPSCGQQLGIAVNFLQDDNFNRKGYGFSVKSFRFDLPPIFQRNTFKQWQKVPVDILEDSSE